MKANRGENVMEILHFFPSKIVCLTDRDRDTNST